MEVREATAGDRPLVADLLARWNSTTVVCHGAVYEPITLPALLAWHDAAPAGLLTYTRHAEGLEVVTLHAVERRTGAGTALLRAAADRAGDDRLWLITTNDNIDALRFYQRRGMRIAGVAPGVLAESRKIKPSIPLIGDYGIPIRDEITLELPPAGRR